MYVPLPSVTIDIVGQNYKKGTEVKYQKRDTSRLFNPFGWKVSSSCYQKDPFFLRSSTLSFWSINLISQSYSSLWLTSAKWALNDSCLTFFVFKKFLWAHLQLLNLGRKSAVLPVYSLEHDLRVNRYTTFSEETFRSSKTNNGKLMKYLLMFLVWCKSQV